MKNLVIIGAGNVGGFVASYFKNCLEDFNLIGFLDDDSSKAGKDFIGYPILGKIECIVQHPTSTAIIIGIASATVKATIVEKLRRLGYNNFPSLVANNTWVSEKSVIGEGCIIYPGVMINYNCTIGSFVVLNMNCAIGHDCVLEDYVNFCPGVLLGGNTTIGRYTDMGIGSQTKQSIAIGQNSIIGAGAVIINDVEDNAVVVGNPGKVLRSIEEENED